MPIRILSRNGYNDALQRRSNGQERRDPMIEEADRYLEHAQLKTSPGWIPWAAGALGLCAIVYGLLQIESVRNAMKGAAESIGDFLMGDALEESAYSSRFGSGELDCVSEDFGSNIDEELLSRL